MTHSPPSPPSPPPGPDRRRLAPEPAGTADRLDGALWLAALMLLWLVPFGRVSGDGLGYAVKIAAGVWRWNPNHLLFEPAGAAWHALLAASGSTRPVVDQLKMLSLLAGAIGAGLFRAAVAPRLAPRRWAANHATAWLVLAAAPLHQLMDDEYHMIQMPLLVGLAAVLPRCFDRGGFRRSAAAGALAGGAALCMISNALLGVTAAAALGAWHWARGERRRAGRTAAGVLAGLLLIGGAGLGAGWWLSHSERPLLSWLVTYAGGAAPPRGVASYGTRWTPTGTAEAAARTAYGAAKVAVDLGPAVVALRDEHQPRQAALVLLAWLAGTAALAGGLHQALRLRRAPPARHALLLQAVWWPAVLAFGLFWNDSADQFFFQLAVPLAALAAFLPAPRSPDEAPVAAGAARSDHPTTTELGRRPADGAVARPRASAGRRLAPALLLCSGFALLWNGADTVRRIVLLPRAAWTADLLRQVAGAGLVVTPGYDDAAILLYLTQEPAQDRAQEPAQDRGARPAALRLHLISLTDLAVREPAAQGLPRLAAAIRRSLAAARRVDLIDLWDGAPDQSPWKYLRRLGYERAALRATLNPFGVDARPRAAGPFLIRSIRPAPAAPTAHQP